MGNLQSQMLQPDAVETDYQLSARITSVTKDLKDLSIRPRRLKPKKNGVIGAGGYGEVYVATLDESSPNQKEVAVKQLFTPQNTSDRKRLALRLVRELKIWANLQHQNILKLQGFYLSSDCQVARLISVYMVNGNVLSYISQKHPDAAMGLNFVQGITAGLKYLHDFKPPIAHGDLKPANVLISDSLDAILCDFGVASFVGTGSSGLTTTGTIKGTIRYMSPELVQGVEEKHTLLTDIWAWACTTYEILTDIKPFEKAKITRMIMIEILQKNTPGSLDQLRSRLPSGQNVSCCAQLLESIASCWDYDPSKRPAVAKIIQDCGFPSETVAESSSAVRKYQAGGPKKREPDVAKTLAIIPFIRRKGPLHFSYLHSGLTLLARLRWEPARCALKPTKANILLFLHAALNDNEEGHQLCIRYGTHGDKASFSPPQSL